MPSVVKVLRNDREPIPEWLLAAGTRCDAESLTNFFSSRVVYYPGAGQDGRAFELFGATHCAHCILHIDWTNTGEDIQNTLTPNGVTGIRGYDSALSELNPPVLRAEISPRINSALWTILARRPGLSDDHGPSKLAFLHVQAEAVRFCSKVWGRLDDDPFAVVLQEHGWGGIDRQETQFGEARRLADVARTTALAKYLLVAHGTKPWLHYLPISRLTTHEYGQDRQSGGGGHQVRLYQTLEQKAV